MGKKRRNSIQNPQKTAKCIKNSRRSRFYKPYQRRERFFAGKWKMVEEITIWDERWRKSIPARFRWDSGWIRSDFCEKARISQALEIERGVQTAQLPFLLFNNNRSEALRKRERKGKFARVSFNYGSDYVLISFWTDVRITLVIGR